MKNIILFLAFLIPAWESIAQVNMNVHYLSHNVEGANTLRWRGSDGTALPASTMIQHANYPFHVMSGNHLAAFKSIGFGPREVAMHIYVKKSEGKILEGAPETNGWYAATTIRDTTILGVVYQTVSYLNKTIDEVLNVNKEVPTTIIFYNQGHLQKRNVYVNFKSHNPAIVLDYSGVTGAVAVPGFSFFTTFQINDLPVVLNDVNVTTINRSVIGSMGTNDYLPASRMTHCSHNNAYQHLTLLESPAGSSPVISLTSPGSGGYTFTGDKPGVYKYSVRAYFTNFGSSSELCNNTFSRTSLLEIKVADTTCGQPNPPIANYDIASVRRGLSSVVIKTLENDKTLDRVYTLNPASVTILTPPIQNGASATVNPANGDITYSLSAASTFKTGRDSLRYQVCDNAPVPQCATSWQYILIDTARTPNHLIPSDNFYVTRRNTPIAGNLITNDYDPDGYVRQALPQTSSTTGAGTINILSDGSFTFTPLAGFVGNLKHEYIVRNISTNPLFPSDTSKATVYISIIPENKKPVVHCVGDTTIKITTANCHITLPDFKTRVRAEDNCSPTPSLVFTQIPAAGTILTGSGSPHTVKVIITDHIGQKDSCSFNVIVVDTIAPTFVKCQNDTTIRMTGVNCEASIPDFRPLVSVTDNCTVSASITLTQIPAAGTVISGNGGTRTVLVIATDLQGNKDTCSFVVTVSDLVAPTFVKCQNDTIIRMTGTNCEVTLPDFRPLVSVTDNCTVSASITLTQIPAAGAVVSGHGTTQTVLVIATDLQGNKDTCSFVVTISDLIAPTFTKCQNDTTIRMTGANCEITLPDFTPLVSVTDNCTVSASITLTQVPASGTVISGHGTTQTVLVIAADLQGNKDTCSFIVRVADSIAPVFVKCQNDTTLNLTGGSCSIVLPDFVPLVSATDNCTPVGTITLTQVPASGTILSNNGSVHTVLIVAADAVGNKDTCSFIVSLNDTIAPTFVVCQNDTTINMTGSNCEIALPDFTPLVSVTDNCTPAGTITLTQVPVAGTVLSGHGTTQTVLVIAADQQGNKDTCSFIVTVSDTISPVFVVCQNDTTIHMTGSNCEIALPDFTPLVSVTDNCTSAGTITLTQVPVAGTVLSGHGTTQTVLVIAEDQQGNKDTCSFVVTVSDTIVPAFVVCQNDTTINMTGSNCEIVLPDFTPLVSVTDNCTPAGTITLTQVPAAGIVLSGHGTTQTVLVIAEDQQGNKDTCSFVVTVSDTIAPTFIVCQGDTSIYLEGANCQAILPDYTGQVTITDNCTSTASIVVTQVPAPGSVYQTEGQTETVLVIAEDQQGNRDTCSFVVTVSQALQPYHIVCIGDTTLTITGNNCEVPLPDYTGLIAIEANCNATVIPTIVQIPAAGVILSGNNTIQEVKIIVTDQFNNRDSCTFTVTLQDSVAPVITTCLADNQVVINTTDCIYTIPDYTVQIAVQDNCTSQGNLTYQQVPQAGQTVGVKDTSYTVTVYVYDENQNVDSCRFIVTLKDERPLVSAGSDSTASFCSTGTKNLNELLRGNTHSGVWIHGSNPDLTTHFNPSTGVLNLGGLNGTYVLLYVVNQGCFTDTSKITVIVRESVENEIPAEGSRKYCAYKDKSINLNTVANSPENGNWVADNSSVQPNIDAGGNLNLNNLPKGEYIFRKYIETAPCEFNIVVLKVTIQCTGLNIPNYFTPNGDGEDDVFDIEGIEAYPDNELVITNRWGNLVYEAKGYKNTWDGRSQSKYNIGGDDLPTGTYYYILDTKDSELGILKGYIYLSR